MPKKLPPTGTDKDLNLATLSDLFTNEKRAIEWLESKRWPNGAVCPHCDCKECYKLVPKEGTKRPRYGFHKCKSCRKKFTVRIGTIFEETRLPISKWLMAIHLMSSSKKGVSSHQIARELGITVKSAWFMTHRVREAMKLEPLAGMLQGVVEADETYVGGKPRRRNGLWGEPNKAGRGTKKAPVMVLVERDGSARCKPLENVSGKTLKYEIDVNVSKEAILMTDELAEYRKAAAGHGGHYRINHSFKRYARRDKATGLNVHTNTAESFFSLLKRGHYGIFHQLSKKHLHRYCTEFGFRWNHRHVSDGERMVSAVKGAEGKRLYYKQPVGGLIA